MLKIRLLGLLTLALIAIGLFPGSQAFAATRNSGFLTKNAHSSAQDSYVFNVTIQGNIDQAVSFNLPAQLLLVPTISPGSSHPFDLCLAVGSQTKPYSDPETGAITLDSNSGCVQGFQSQTDMGSLSYDQSTAIATFQVDPNASPLGVNAFNTSSGIAGGVEIVVSGNMQLQFYHDSTTNYVRGQIAVVGNESAYSPTQGDSYSATITGSTN